MKADKHTDKTLAIELFGMGRWVLWAMAVPCVVFVVMFSIVPLFGWAYAFIKYQPGNTFFNSEFVGLYYFRKIFTDSELILALRNTLMFSLLSYAASPLPMVFAIALSEVKSESYRKLVQSVTTFPNFISWIIIYAISLVAFSVDDGFVNKFLSNFNLIEKPLNLLADKNAVWILQTCLGLWKGLGFGAIIYFAAITSIDPELLDAASIDGAGRFRRIWHIKVPFLLPTFLILFLLGIGNLLSTNFEQLYTFYNPIVHYTIQTIDLYTYKIGIEQGNYSLSTAVGISRTFISVILLFSANALSRKLSGRVII